MKTMKMLAVAFVAAFLMLISGCGGGGGNDTFIPTAAEISATNVPPVPRGQKSVTTLLVVAVQSYGTSLGYVVKNDSTGTVLDTSPPGTGTTTGPIRTGGSIPDATLIVGENKVSVYINGATNPTTTTKIVVSCAPGTAPDANGVCN